MSQRIRAGAGAGNAHQRRVSRAPVYVVLGFFVVALTLVMLGAMRSAEKLPAAPAVIQPGTSAVPRPVTVIMRDYLFEPEPLALVPGETVRITAVNAGLEPHELVLGNAAAQGAWSAANAAATPPGPFTTPPPASAPAGTAGVRLLVRSGEQASVEWTVPVAEPLFLQCHLAGHQEQGMSGVVVLQQAQPSASQDR
jgi:uncharacterized cupredoxin-like copper-binding protein